MIIPKPQKNKKIDIKTYKLLKNSVLYYKVNNSNDLADKIKLNCIKKIKDVGYYEYFNSDDISNINSGCGDNLFSWTASMYICMISNMKM